MNRLMGPLRAIIAWAVICFTITLAENFGPSHVRALGTEPFDLSGRDAATAVRGRFNGRLVFTSDRKALVAELNAGAQTRPSVFRRVVDDERLKTKLFRPTFVSMQYVGYLRRGHDEGGFNFWLTKLNQFNGDYIAAEMVKAFIVSGEYRGRFGQP